MTLLKEDASKLQDVIPDAKAQDKPISKDRDAKIYLCKADPATLKWNDAVDGRKPPDRDFVRRIPGITEYGAIRLSRQLQNVWKGRSSALTTPLLKEGETLHQFADVCLKFAEERLADHPVLLEVERSNAKKCSPQSIMLPYSKREPQLNQYFVDHGGDVTEEEIALACDLIWRFIGNPDPHRLRPLPIEAACERLPKSTQWGLPFVVNGCARMSTTEEAAFASQNGIPLSKCIAYWDYREAYLSLAKEMLADPNHQGWELPCMMGWRGDLGQPGKDEDNPEGTKQRVVWMYPHAVSILESMFYPVLTNFLRSKPGFAAWRPEVDTRQVIYDMLTGLGDEQLLWAFDASGFDYHLSPKLIQGVSRNIIQRFFQEGSAQTIERLSQFSMTCGMVTPKGIKTGRTTNRPSGSGGTNLLDCFENLVMFAVVALRCGYSKEWIVEKLKEVMGDDAVYVVDKDFEDAGFTPMYEKAFGAIVNTDKENLSSEFTTYLKRVYTKDLRGAASFVRMMLKAATYERPTPKGWSMYLTEERWMDILGNLSTSPIFEDAIEFVIQRAPLGLGTSLEGGVDQLLASAADIAWKESGRSVDELLDAEDRTLGAELGLMSDKPGKVLVIEYLRNRVA